MNMLLYTANDFVHENLLRIRGDQAEHLIKEREILSGAHITVGELNGKISQATILEVGVADLLIQVADDGYWPEPAFVNLIVALPRPQILKRVLQTAATMGVKRLAFISSARGEKSYFSSKILQPDILRYHLRLGLEQGVNTIEPIVSVHSSFQRFVGDELKAIDAESKSKLVTSPQSEKELSHLHLETILGASDFITIAVGPEAGWEDPEVAAFCEHGYHCCCFGKRILRVDTAVCAVLAQIDLLRKLK